MAQRVRFRLKYCIFNEQIEIIIPNDKIEMLGNTMATNNSHLRNWISALRWDNWEMVVFQFAVSFFTMANAK